MPKIDQTAAFLQKIGQIESSNNYNAAHHPMSFGIHQGMRAVGKYGMMPYTITELMNRRAAEGLPDDPRLPGNLAESLSPGSPEYRGASELTAHEVAADPTSQEILAKYLASKLLRKTGGDEEKAAFMWNQGHNRNPEDITPDQLEQSDYVQKFRALTPAPAQQMPKLKKLMSQNSGDTDEL